ncbi:hypothetical protein QNI16_36310 [Cytophagaceae bacterium YF14B1]|uniref:Uncharacterized protein n=1 Tax=Xanthocytophaga flava TaxID=3048013 RepID=A0AAE3UBQ1_9BACT|nr:hypothetical protein [Xanthocytophaga flavus]MDJ1486002.1 hypothetical protein [Xanthocytophaga flavus]
MTNENISLENQPDEPPTHTNPFWLTHAILFSILIAFAPRIYGNDWLGSLILLFFGLPFIILFGLVRLIISLRDQSFRKVWFIPSCFALVLSIAALLLRFSYLGPVARKVSVAFEPWDRNDIYDFKGIIPDQIYSVYVFEDIAHIVYAVGTLLVWIYLIRHNYHSYFRYALLMHYLAFALAFYVALAGPAHREKTVQMDPFGMIENSWNYVSKEF